jgi:flagellar basal-body rod protein FlgB
MNDVTIDALQGLLRGLAQRQRTISDNIANIETPNYKAQRVEFENALADALRRGGNANIRPSIVPTNDPSLPNGNNVSIDQEIVLLQDTQLRYQLAIEALTSKMNLIRSSMRSTL